MNDFKLKFPKPKIEAKFISSFKNPDIEELCDATEDAILVDGGFGWINPPQRKKLFDYWKGVLLVPERLLIVGKMMTLSVVLSNLLSLHEAMRPSPTYVI